MHNLKWKPKRRILVESQLAVAKVVAKALASRTMLHVVMQVTLLDDLVAHLCVLARQIAGQVAITSQKGKAMRRAVTRAPVVPGAAES